MAELQTSGSFFWRRMHSFTGLLLVVFLIEHLLTNSQAALWLGDDGEGFIHAVNAIHNLPYLYVLELSLIGAPLLVHLIWGVRYIFTSAPNSTATDGTRPALGYSRNRAYTWQRITSWVLAVLILGHVAQMRFYHYPTHAKVGDKESYMVRVDEDPGLVTLADRLDIELYNASKIQTQQEVIQQIPATENNPLERALLAQKKSQEQQFLQALEARPITENQRIAVAPDFGTAVLMIVRDVFKSPIMIALYTLLVLSASFHGFNGLWTFLITWGVSLTPRAQVITRKLTTALMVLIAGLGLAAVWLTYFVNLRQ